MQGHQVGPPYRKCLKWKRQPKERDYGDKFQFRLYALAVRCSDLKSGTYFFWHVGCFGTQ
jgi:hypothetical protein